jgi:hypothetical protein
MEVRFPVDRSRGRGVTEARGAASVAASFVVPRTRRVLQFSAVASSSSQPIRIGTTPSSSR